MEKLFCERLGRCVLGFFGSGFGIFWKGLLWGELLKMLIC